jgi:spermidine/putrescine transport system ATP-binding protein
MLELTNLTKTYDNKPLLRGISFSVAPGETICLLGASGSGKSTILRIIAGLEQAEVGEVRWEGRDVSFVPAHKRNFGLMFQDYALFPHLSVFENVAFGLKMQSSDSKIGRFWSPIRSSHAPKTGRERVARLGDENGLQMEAREGEKKWQDSTQKRVTTSLALVKMTGFEQRRVTELSGGEQQRVAMARALAPNPHLLMLDEPLGALDRALKESLLDELRHILRQTGSPAIYVTHDQEEAFTIADRIILLHEGRIAQAGTPAEVFAKPANSWVATFLGLGNVFDGQVEAGAVETSFGRFQIKCDQPIGETVTLLIRPQAELAADGAVTGKVADVVFRGAQFRVELENGLYFHLATAPRLGETIRLKVNMECL